MTAETEAESTTAPRDGRRSAAAARRRIREREILDATRRLFDERGVRDAQIEDIARAVGINRAIVYRHFSGKEELFALTVVDYLSELETRLREVDAGGTASDRLTGVVDAFMDFGMEFPAFVDCVQTLMRRPGPELLEEISESVLFRLGRGMAACLGLVTAVIQDGIDSGEFEPGNADVRANILYASGLGALQLARIGMVVKEAAPGVPTIIPLSIDEVRQYAVASALALARS